MAPATDRQAVRRRERRENLCAATVRALTGDAALEYRDGRLCRDLRPLPFHAPHLRHDTQSSRLETLRGVTDGAALRLMHSAANLHARLCPADPVERLVFELLEQLRCESLTPQGMPGLADNLRHQFEAWSRRFYRSGQAESHLGNLLYTVAQISWSHLSGWPVLEENDGLIEATRAAITPTLGASLVGLRRHRAEQSAFALHALEMARLVSAMIHAARAQEKPGHHTTGNADEATLTALSLWFDGEDFENADINTPLIAASDGDGDDVKHAGKTSSATGYRVFTTRYDRELHPHLLIRPVMLAEYRQRLDEHLATQHLNLPRLSHALRLALALPQRDGWSFGEEHGQLDGRRLAQLISSPAEKRLFLLSRNTLQADCTISFLLDCSGSMRTHIEAVAVMVDVLVRALEHAGVTTEVLGFTTGAWNGGRARLDWLARGSPARPGRLSERSHMVFKEASTRWRRARNGIATLFKADLFREGVDGEAIDWACLRLLARPERRRIMIVISDGSPMDRATDLANAPGYLEQHLRAVIARHETARKVDVLGLGIGLDLSRFYRHCLAIDLSAMPTMALFSELVRWISNGGRPVTGAR
ncbi:cobalt chelatase [Paraburkholderia bonniea]|uniref:cobaltochelatase CobT-related protein n=1 Tax=Paraburkholderia bonniea TaxID=2152891 RepID=UPI0012912445|nr:cobalt chelatase [Paraburkholderia bonniea]WJF90447.1 cobalt chelatase [Paraburkholderia bonniea]WJF93762.1 cobalt chelatase [Paraburkholderia bonniea]